MNLSKSQWVLNKCKQVLKPNWVGGCKWSWEEPRALTKFCKHKTNRDQSVNIKERSSVGNEHVQLKKGTVLQLKSVASRPTIGTSWFFKRGRNLDIMWNLFKIFFQLILFKKYCVGNFFFFLKYICYLNLGHLWFIKISSWNTGLFMIWPLTTSPSILLMLQPIYILEHNELHTLLLIYIYIYSFLCLLDSHNTY